MIAPFPPIAAPAMARPLRLSPAPPSPVVDAGSPGQQAFKAPAGRGPQSPPGAPGRRTRAPGGLYVCDTELVPGPLSFERSRPCEAVPAFPFAALCECGLLPGGRGHLIGGYACAACLGSAGRGCLSCWRKPGRGRRPHECRVVLYAPGRPP